jgi:cation:H+ antiporter
MGSMDLALLVVGGVLLVVGASLLVRGASALALRAGIPPVVTGLTVVAFATSAPELAVTVAASIEGDTALASANVVGSNVLNIVLILGLAGLVAPLLAPRRVLRVDIPLMIGLSVGVAVLALVAGEVGRIAGLILVSILVGYVGVEVRAALRRSRSRQTSVALEAEGFPGTDGILAVEAVPTNPWFLDLGAVAVGLGGLVLGAAWLVDGASSIALDLGVSETVVGLTIVAIGTSAPEIATSVVATIRGEREIAVGNAVGSNIFNLGLVLGLGALVSPTGLPLDPAVIGPDLLLMVGAAVGCWAAFRSGSVLDRSEAGLFLVVYVTYLAWLVADASEASIAPVLGAVAAAVGGGVLLWLGAGALRAMRSPTADGTDPGDDDHADIETDDATAALGATTEPGPRPRGTAG